MSSQSGAGRLEREGRIQTACDHCTQGVMDSTNPHMWGACNCRCHRERTEGVSR